MASSDTGFFSIFFYLFCDILQSLDIVEINTCLYVNVAAERWRCGVGADWPSCHPDKWDFILLNEKNISLK